MNIARALHWRLRDSESNWRSADYATPDGSSGARAAEQPGDGYTAALRMTVLLFIALATVAIAAIYFVFLNPVIDYRVDQTGDAIAYLFLTRSLAETATYPSVHWSPGLPMLFAPLVRLAGEDMTLIKLGMVALALGTAGAVFAWATPIVGRFAAALVALSVASSPVFFDYSHRFLSEIPFTLFVVLFFVFLQRSSFVRGRAGILEYAVLAAVAAMVQLTRGNGIVLVPALLMTAATSRGPLRDGNTRARVWIAFLIVSLAIPAVAWNIRNAQRSFPGIHGSTYLDELKARRPMELWSRGSGPGTDQIETVSFRDFWVRLYRNIAWGQIFNYPRAAANPIDLVVRSTSSTPVALLVVLPVWGILLTGVGLLYRKCPFAVWFLGFTTIVLVVWPWPWGASIRFITPVIPVLALAFYLGLNRLIGPRWTAVLTMFIVAVNLWQSVHLGIDQRRAPYASAEFANVLALVEAARGELRPNEALVIDPSIAGLGLVKAGRPAIDVNQAIADMREGKSASSLAVVSTLTPEVGLRIDRWAREQPGTVVQSVRRVGASQLIRVEGRRGS